jgi:hypothetical protein
MTTELDRYYSRQGIRISTVGKMIRRIKRDVPAQTSDRAVLEIRMEDAKNAYELKGVQWATEDIMDANFKKASLLKTKRKFGLK